jgi:hypothetical protein
VPPSAAAAGGGCAERGDEDATLRWAPEKLLEGPDSGPSPPASLRHIPNDISQTPAPPASSADAVMEIA